MAIKEFVEMKPGDVNKTYADVVELSTTYNYLPNTPIEIGLHYFVNWFKNYSANSSFPIY